MTGDFIIVLSDPQTCVPGGTVSGNVTYHAVGPGPEKTKGINITFNGSMRCNWSVGKRLYSGFEQIFLLEKKLLSHGPDVSTNSLNTLCAVKTGGGTAVELQPGWHTYPFSFTLPYDIPSSFRGKHGKIKYKLTATMKRPHRFNNTAELTVHVKDFLDLGLLPTAGIPLTCQLQKTFSSLLLGESGSVNVTFKISKSGIAIGQRVPTTLNFHNESDTTINVCNIYLIGVVRYQTNNRHHEVCDKAYKTLVKVVKNVLREEQRSVAAGIKIPKSLNLPATNFSSSSLRIISLDYYFELELKFASWAKDLKKKVPIIIGTVPVNGPSSEREMSQTSNLDNSAERSQDSEANDSNELDLPPPYENFENLPPSYEEAIYWN